MWGGGPFGEETPPTSVEGAVNPFRWKTLKWMRGPIRRNAVWEEMIEGFFSGVKEEGV